MRPRISLSVASAALFALAVTFAAARPQAGGALGIGTPLAPGELSAYFSYRPNGATLPPGRGSVGEGKAIYTNVCAACHGDKLQGIKPTGAPALVGGRGTLATPTPVKTVESYWPYATTLFDYVKRAMPINAPGSLSDDEIYAVCAYILAQGHVVPEDAVLDKTSLPAVVMPNRGGFRPFQGPDRRFFH